MKKKKIRCFKVFAHVYAGVYNHLVYLPTREGWSGFTFATCINCGEIFVIDLENPVTNGLSISQIAGSMECPTCKLPLQTTVRKYPEFIKLPNGVVGSFKLSESTSIDGESSVVEFYEIVPV